MGNNAACRVTEIRNVNFKLHDRTLRELREVSYIPKLKKNLISLGMLTKWL